MSITLKLLGLQELEIEIASLEKALAEGRSRLGESRQLLEARQTKSTLEESHRQATSRLKTLEWQSEDLKNKLKHINDQLYSGRITNPKELTNLQHEAEVLSANMADIDEQALREMENTETLWNEFNLAVESLAGIEETWKLDQQQLMQDIQAASEKLARLRQKRDEAAAEIDAQVIQVYERIKTQRSLAVARVVNGTCEGCHISLSSAQLQHARSASMEKCANCGRILFCE
ncbi:MAG: hypothetical protein JW954_01005 [Dehalococcoidaceae bacterium]|nr:hypothetical protein [Dehalococcoidaceae bacterium]